MRPEATSVCQVHAFLPDGSEAAVRRYPGDLAYSRVIEPAWQLGRKDVWNSLEEGVLCGLKILVHEVCSY